MQPLHIRQWFGLLGELPVLITRLVAQDFQANHGHEPRPDHQAHSYYNAELNYCQDRLLSMGWWRGGFGCRLVGGWRVGWGCIKLWVVTPYTITLVRHGIVKVWLMHIQFHIHIPCTAGVTAGVVLVCVRHVTVNEGEEKKGKEEREHLQLPDH